MDTVILDQQQGSIASVSADIIAKALLARLLACLSRLYMCLESLRDEASAAIEHQEQPNTFYPCLPMLSIDYYRVSNLAVLILNGRAHRGQGFLSGAGLKTNPLTGGVKSCKYKLKYYLPVLIFIIIVLVLFCFFFRHHDSQFTTILFLTQKYIGSKNRRLHINTSGRRMQIRICFCADLLRDRRNYPPQD
ncbi:hypothetical protein L211DRAFT_36148 [Terfezia boudieri ATCC MYA-4762]|uniref:Uncharacterized protein n=1 Tax=Terfezia boudieri ATCC MYA-4762 TaxID=1051890 RepID=A0A3N4M3U3_9PEZI|nr:hypothetical protein L211DRAFT_36148 [Terfezia boudieri ATCC MYA-4762]